METASLGLRTFSVWRQAAETRLRLAEAVLGDCGAHGQGAAGLKGRLCFGELWDGRHLRGWLCVSVRRVSAKMNSAVGQEREGGEQLCVSRETCREIRPPSRNSQGASCL